MQVWGGNDESLLSIIFFVLPKNKDYKDLIGYEHAFIVDFSEEYKTSRKQQGAEIKKN